MLILSEDLGVASHTVTEASKAFGEKVSVAIGCSLEYSHDLAASLGGRSSGMRGRVDRNILSLPCVKKCKKSRLKEMRCPSAPLPTHETYSQSDDEKYLKLIDCCPDPESYLAYLKVYHDSIVDACLKEDCEFPPTFVGVEGRNIIEDEDSLKDEEVGEDKPKGDSLISLLDALEKINWKDLRVNQDIQEPDQSIPKSIPILYDQSLLEPTVRRVGDKRFPGIIDDFKRQDLEDRSLTFPPAASVKKGDIADLLEEDDDLCGCDLLEAYDLCGSDWDFEDLF